MTARQLPFPDDECPDALACGHVCHPPTEAYLAARRAAEIAAMTVAYPGLSAAHMNAIWKARREFPGRAAAIKRAMQRSRVWRRQRARERAGVA